ncbi:MAG: hypothetical protein Q7T74_02405, partial [Candidatus Saccharibacteria bacterium]|nr:hypothetical protein [Candidatus Saccharibacteria bacterium]
MKTVHYSILAVLFFMMGCTPMQYSPEQLSIAPAHHQYEILFVDADGNPLEGVKIEYNLTKSDYHNNFLDTIVESSSYT